MFQSFLLLSERDVVETPAQLSLLKRSPLPENIVLRLEDYTAKWSKVGDNRGEVGDNWGITEVQDNREKVADFGKRVSDNRECEIMGIQSKKPLDRCR